MEALKKIWNKPGREPSFRTGFATWRWETPTAGMRLVRAWRFPAMRPGFPKTAKSP